jgi:hypothetical protein
VTKHDLSLTPDRASLLASLEGARGDWERLLVQVGLPRMTVPGVSGEWSVKDIVAHVAAYEHWTAGHVAAATRDSEPTTEGLYGTAETPPGVDTFDTEARNAAVVAWWRDAPLDAVSAFAQRAFDALVAAVQDAPESLLFEPDAVPWLDGIPLADIVAENSFRHYEQHAPALRAWIMQTEGLPAETAEPVE